MDKFRSKIKWRMFFGSVIMAFSALLAVLDQIGLFDKLEFIKKNEIISTFQLGFVTGIGLVAAAMMFKYNKVLKDDMKLRMLYNEEADERLGLIRQKSGMPMLMVTSCIMVFAGIIAGYINETVFYTLILAAMIQMVIGLIVKFYYTKKI